MKFLTLVSTGLLISCTNAGKFSQPIFCKKTYPSEFTPKAINTEERDQKILQPTRGEHWKEGSRPFGLPVQSIQTLLYTTPISFGTPPQSIPAIIDTVWGDLFVPSVDCGGSHHCANKTKYNSSSSSTYADIGAIKRTTYGPVFAYGKESVDTLTLGDLQVAEQHFWDLSYYEEVYPDDGLEGWDSVLGLTYEVAPWMDDYRAPNILSSPFKNLVKRQVLDNNIFAIKLPRNDTDVGDISFGRFDEDLIEEESKVWNALYPENIGQWQIEVVGVSMASAGTRAQVRKENFEKGSLNSSYSGLLMTVTPALGFPHATGQELLSHLPHEESSCGGQSVVPCSSIPDLPDLIISLAGGHEIVLKGADYIAEITLPWCREPVVECLPLIEAFPEHMPGIDIPEDLMILGSAVLRSGYVVFDWDERRVGFGKLKG